MPASMAESREPVFTRFEFTLVSITASLDYKYVLVLRFTWSPDGRR